MQIPPATPLPSRSQPRGPLDHGGPTDPSHDAKLRRGIIETRVSRVAAVAIAAFFLALIGVVPVGEAVLEKANGDDSPLVEIFRHAPTAERLRRFEDDIEQASYAKEFVQPRVQAALTRFGRVGNKKAVVGFRRWLYYRPGITHVGGPGFLQSSTIRARERAAADGGDPPVHADPRPAIFGFHSALAKRGIGLILFPVPDKATLQPLELHGRGARTRSGDGAAEMRAPRNLDWNQFAGEMRDHGVAVFDPTPPVLHRGEPPRFLVQDTHWTPEWMEEVAAQLANVVTRTATLTPSDPGAHFSAVSKPVECLGDVAIMLKLLESQTLFRQERATITEVDDASGAPWEPDPKGEVLLLGDSFTNVFSMEPMGWGTAAGLGAQLARALGRGVDVIARNDSGAFATREALARELRAGEDRLAGKKVVIWEFASRELSVGDWKPCDWADAASQEVR